MPLVFIEDGNELEELYITAKINYKDDCITITTLRNEQISIRSDLVVAVAKHTKQKALDKVLAQCKLRRKLKVIKGGRSG